MISACAFSLAAASSAGSSVTRAVKVSALYSTVISGLARRLKYQSGCFGDPAAEAAASDRVQDDQRRVAELGHLAAVCPELVDDLGIPIAHSVQGRGSSGVRMPRRAGSTFRFSDRRDRSRQSAASANAASDGKRSPTSTFTVGVAPVPARS